MTEHVILQAARDYADRWHIHLGELQQLRVLSKSLFVPTCFKLEYTIHNAIAQFTLSRSAFSMNRSPQVVCFQIIPDDATGWLLPLWAVYPGWDSTSMIWRDGGKEEIYKYRWHDWYRSLSDENRQVYKRRFPPDASWGADWYEAIAERKAESSSIQDYILNRV